MKEKGRATSSKVLLFGEYTLMSGSMALSVPYRSLYGQLLFDGESGKSSHYSTNYLLDYLDFLKKKGVGSLIDISDFENDIENGLFFETNIPISYGLGSSGSIVASIYESYALEKTTDFLQLKSIFSLMESYYHGKSSGLDPLVSYTDLPILFEADNSIKTVKLPVNNNSGTIFLIDTETSGETQPLVNWYLEKMNNSSFRQGILKSLVPLNNKCITEFLTKPLKDYLGSIRELSEFTFENFQRMIPEAIIPFWEEGLASEKYFLKLCGSGGGGMMIGFTDDFAVVSEKAHGKKIHKLMDI